MPSFSVLTFSASLLDCDNREADFFIGNPRSLANGTTGDAWANEWDEVRPSISYRVFVAPNGGQ